MARKWYCDEQPDIIAMITQGSQWITVSDTDGVADGRHLLRKLIPREHGDVSINRLINNYGADVAVACNVNGQDVYALVELVEDVKILTERSHTNSDTSETNDSGVRTIRHLPVKLQH